MSEDAELLGRYASERSESAFTELIRRHVDLVYSAALRLAGGDIHRAQDVPQQAFTELHRQARRRRKRALEKLRAQLARKGVTTTATALALALTGNAATAAPTAFVATLTGGSIAGAAAAGGTTFTLLKFMTTTKLKTGIIGTIAAA